MPVLIDGYNLLHVARRLDEEGDFGRQQLCHMLGRWAGLTRQQVMVVFDGTQPSEGLGEQLHGRGVDVSYSGGGRTADQEIIERIAASTAPRRLTVVSSDRVIRRAAKRRRCVSVDSASFLETVLRRLVQAPRPRPEPPEKRAGLQPGETDEWLRLFRYDQDDEGSDDV